ncbi:MAG TPA: cytochrome c [Bryobacterales bacterium]|nr:cytochrome c [Bryobacterales bacterium]
MRSPTALNALLLAALAGSAALNWIARRDPARPNLDFLPDMARSARYNAFAPNPNFADGKTLQRPVPGAIPRGYLPLHFEATPADAARAGRELHNPFSASDAKAFERGANVYVNFCLPCHGGQGKGDGAVVFRGYPAPPPLTAQHAVGLPDGQIFHILTYGQKNMPSYASQLAREDRWKVILYVRSLQKPPAAPPAGGRP